MDQGSEKLAQSEIVVAREHACDSRVESNDVPASENNGRIDFRDDCAASRAAAPAYKHSLAQ
jgi:hypothetical protein